MREAAIRSKDAARERRCIVTGEVLSDAELVRFCVDPDGNVVPDVAANLPGRGIWVRASREMIERAAAKNLFAKAAGAKAVADKALADRTERLIVERMLSDVGLARRSGALILGFDSVVRAFDTKLPPCALVEAGDGAPDGRRKILAEARARGLQLAVIDGLTSRQMSLALGRENVIHAALKPGRLAERLISDAERLKGLRSAAPETAGASLAVRNERDE